MQFMNSSLEKLVKDLSENDFKCLAKEFGPKKLALLKKRMLIHASTWTVSNDLVKKNCLIKIFLQICKRRNNR